MKGLEEMTYDKLLRRQGLLSSEKKRPVGDLTAVCNFLLRGNREGGADPLSLASRDAIQGSRSKLYRGVLGLWGRVLVAGGLQRWLL